MIVPRQTGQVLAIECATEACSVALFDGDKMLANNHRVLGRGHAEQLIPMIADLPENGQADRILVSLGPGSFTGVRIGIAAARALAIAWNSKVEGYPTLALVAAMARNQAGPQPVLTCMSGGHRQWFVQPFAADGIPAAAHQSMQPDDAMQTYDTELVAGSQAEAFIEGREKGGRELTILPNAAYVSQIPGTLLTGNLQPIYGRKPDARLPT